MLNGKFYTGLPPKMIEKSSIGRDHQKTNFFWPDETNSKSVSENKVRKSLRNDSTETSTNCEPQKLFKKELTSKIQFYDLIDDDLKNKARNKKENVNNLKNNDKQYGKTKQREKSELHDYDYWDGNIEKSERNIKTEIDRNRADLPKLSNKRITFNDNDDKKVYIKNNEINKIPSAFSQRVGLVNKNKSISKSVENLPAKLIKNNTDDQDDNINLIENDIKNLKIPFSKDYYDEGGECEFDQRQHQQINSALKRFPKYLREDKGIAIQDIRRPTYPHKHNYETNYENEKQFSKSQQQNNYSYDKKNHNYNRDERGYYNDSIEKCNSDNTSTRHIEIRLSPSREVISKDKNSSNETRSRNHNNFSYKNNTKNEENLSTYSANEQQCINKNRHLRSNIIFSDQNDNQHSSAPERRTIRSSAVSRVSVGLPEF